LRKKAYYSDILAVPLERGVGDNLLHISCHPLPYQLKIDDLLRLYRILAEVQGSSESDAGTGEKHTAASYGRVGDEFVSFVSFVPPQEIATVGSHDIEKAIA